LDFEKINKDWYIYFNDKQTKEWFCETYINIDYLRDIYLKSLEGYEYLKNIFGKSVFKIIILYQDKQELKTIVNKLINIKLIRESNNEN